MRDGNLVEFGIGAFSEGQESLMLQAPRMKIFRDGRVLIVDDAGAWQARIDPSRIENLERDLLRMPLLGETRFVDVRRRDPILIHGGVSYVRFRDGDDEVLIAASGKPLDRDWRAIIDRVNAERPPTLMSFRPRELKFLLWTWPAAMPSKDEWPFTATLPLAGHDSDPITTTDPAVIAFVVDHAYGHKGIPTAEGDVLYGFIVESAPAWFEITPLQLRLFGLWRDGQHGRGTGVQDGNLVEYGMGGFADGGVGSPMLFPPEVKIYADGRIVFADKKGFWQGTVEPKRLEKLNRDLAGSALLRESRIIPVRNGGLISLHGGMAYIRYRDADHEVVIATLSHARRGPYVRLLERIRREIPTTYSSFRPNELTFRLYPGDSWREPVAWPFSAATPLAGASGSITITDPAAVAFVLDHSFGGFSWMQTNVRENGTDFEIITESVPGWFEPQFLGVTLWQLHLAGSDP